jgi:hypothetical protein
LCWGSGAVKAPKHPRASVDVLIITVDGDRLEFARERLAQEALLQHFESAGVDPHDAADSGFAQQCLDMRAGFDEGGDEVLSANAAVWRDARVVVAVALGVDADRVEIVLDMP